MRWSDAYRDALARFASYRHGLRYWTELCVFDAYRDASASVIGRTPYLLDHLGELSFYATSETLFALLRLAAVLKILKTRCDKRHS